MSDFTISIDWATLRKTGQQLTQAHVDAAASIYRQTRSDADIDHDNAQERREAERHRSNQEWTDR